MGVVESRGGSAGGSSGVVGLVGGSRLVRWVWWSSSMVR